MPENQAVDPVISSLDEFLIVKRAAAAAAAELETRRRRRRKCSSPSHLVGPGSGAIASAAAKLDHEALFELQDGADRLCEDGLGVPASNDVRVGG